MEIGSFAEGQFDNGASWKIFYQVFGSGPDMLLLHGGGPGATGASNYSKNIEELSQHYRCWVIDIPGWGQSSKNLNGFGAVGVFQNGGLAVLAFMDAMGISKAHLIGNSFGGGSALCLAMSHPDRVVKMILMGTAGGVVPGSSGPTEGIIQLLNYYLGEGPSLEKLQAFIGNLVYDQSLLTEELVQQRFDASSDPEIVTNPPLTPPNNKAQAEALVLSNDPRLAELKHRALFVWGRQDKVNPAAAAGSFAVMQNADFVELTSCGHWAQWEHPERFNDMVISFLENP